MRDYKTKNGTSIEMQCFNLVEDTAKSRLFDSIAIQALIGDDVVGYLKLTYIGRENAAKLREPFDFFIYKMYGSDDKTVEAYETKNYSYLLEKLALRDLNITKENLNLSSSEEISLLYSQFKDNINKTYEPQFLNMVEYWVNKPNIELVKVFSEHDISYTDYSQDNCPLVPRKNNVNWQGQGIGAALYEKTARWCQERNLELWCSNTRTNEAIRMWSRMEKMPNFCVIMEQVLKYTSSGEVLKLERPKLRAA